MFGPLHIKQTPYSNPTASFPTFRVLPQFDRCQLIIVHSLQLDLKVSVIICVRGSGMNWTCRMATNLNTQDYGSTRKGYNGKRGWKLQESSYGCLRSERKCSAYMHYITFAQVRVCTLQCLIASWIICNTYPTVSTVPRPVCPRFLKLCRSHQRIPPGVIASYRELQSVKFGQAATTGKFRNVLGCNWMANKRYPSRDGAV